jgi:hypothetical protein
VTVTSLRPPVDVPRVSAAPLSSTFDRRTHLSTKGAAQPSNAVATASPPTRMAQPPTGPSHVTLDCKSNRFRIFINSC